VPRYRFTIRYRDNFDDEDGMILPDDGSAREHAIQIMDELQKDNQADWVDYTMEVKREGRVSMANPVRPPSLALALANL
jgi:hypothetical protein